MSYNCYGYVLNNPLRFVDPSGYFAQGDSTGKAQGSSESMVLRLERKKQQEERLSYATDESRQGPSENQIQVMEEGGSNAQGGGVTFEQAKLWYQFGGGTRMDVDLNSIDLRKVRMSDFNSKGLATVRLDGKHFSSLNDALVHGTITLQRIGNTNQARVALNSDPTTPQINGQPAGMYNFTMHTWGEPISWIRNPVTFMGGIINGLMPIGGTFIYVGGTPFPIYYNGTTTIQH